MSRIDIGFENLLVSGCSFTHNYFDFPNSWPRYLQELTTVANVIDCSCPGAGNTHIQQSLVYKLETDQSLQPDNTLVVVMWSGYDRDDFVVDSQVLSSTYPNQYYYSENTGIGLSGGLWGESNIIVPIENIKKIKNNWARAIDNYVKIVSLYHYLQQRNFRFVFTEFSTAGTLRDANFDIVEYLDPVLQNKFVEMVRGVVPNLGDYSLQSPHQSPDDYHPSCHDHAEWTEKVLLPYILSL